MNEAESTPDAQGSSREPKIIKRYTNRKLYDTVESRYVTLDEIAEMVKNGVEVRIVDNRSKEDLTSVTLAQIIFEEEKKKSQMPLSLLREIIRRPGESISGFIQKEVSPRVASLREEAEHRIDKLLRREDGTAIEPSAEGEEAAASAAAPAAGAGVSAGAGATSPADLLKASQRTWEEFQKKVDDQVRGVVEGVVGSLPAVGRDYQALVNRIEELEKKLAELEARK